MRRWGVLGFAGALVVLAPASARPAEVDLLLVLAVDVSASISQERWDLQRRGYAQAFRNADVIGAIRNGRRGAIAVTLVEWAGADQQKQVIDWTVIGNADEADSFAATLAEVPRFFSGSTSISGGIDYGVRLLEASEHDADRRVIDVSGDGSNNAGRPVAVARDRAVARGITINGLPILADEPYVDQHYREHVIGGPGAFLIVAKDFASFAGAILDKLVREIARAALTGEDEAAGSALAFY